MPQPLILVGVVSGFVLVLCIVLWAIAELTRDAGTDHADRGG